MTVNLYKGDNVNRLHSKVIDTIPYTFKHKILTIKLLGELIMKKISKETKREQRYNANLHNIFVKAQKEINANE